MQTQTLDAFQVIADPSRRQYDATAFKRQYDDKRLAENFDMSRPAVSKAHKNIFNAGFISITDIGRERHCILKQRRL